MYKQGGIFLLNISSNCPKYESYVKKKGACYNINMKEAFKLYFSWLLVWLMSGQNSFKLYDGLDIEIDTSE